MDEGLDFKKLFVWFCIFVCGVVYVRANYEVMDLVKFAKEKPHPVISPKVDYYIGWMKYQQEEYENSHKAFDQILLSYPTSQYVEAALFYKGLMYIDGYRYADARKMYLEYMEKFPEGKYIRQVNKKYEFIKFK